MRTGAGVATYALGLLSGVLIALIAAELAPEPTDLLQYRAVRDFAREAFVREVSDHELCEQALHGMLAELDPYSRFYDQEEARQLERETQGRFRGIGVVFRRPVAVDRARRVDRRTDRIVGAARRRGRLARPQLLNAPPRPGL